MRCMKRDTVKFVVERGEGNYFTRIDFENGDNFSSSHARVTTKDQTIQ